MENIQFNFQTRGNIQSIKKIKYRTVPPLRNFLLSDYLSKGIKLDELKTKLNSRIPILVESYIKIETRKKAKCTAKQFPTTCQRNRQLFELGETRQDIFHNSQICFL